MPPVDLPNITITSASPPRLPPIKPVGPIGSLGPSVRSDRSIIACAEEQAKFHDVDLDVPQVGNSNGHPPDNMSTLESDEHRLKPKWSDLSTVVGTPTMSPTPCSSMSDMTRPTDDAQQDKPDVPDESIEPATLGDTTEPQQAVDNVSIGSQQAELVLGGLLALPKKRQDKTLRNARHIWMNVYRRLFSIVFVLNMVAFVAFLCVYKTPDEMPLNDVATAASANLCIAILVRQDYIVNILFKTLWRIPSSAPLRLRRLVTKIYEHGGVHSGAAVSGTTWFILLTVLVTIQFAEKRLASVAVLTISYILALLLMAITALAYPLLRRTKHNAFEFSHRFAGWISIALFWVEIILIALDFASSSGSSTSKSGLGNTLVRMPTFWFLLVITVHIVLPWLRLRRWEFEEIQLSERAVQLTWAKNLPPLSALAIAQHPLGEWHPFATFPHVVKQADGSDKVVGGSMIISDCGDWTAQTILEPRKRYWVKGIPKTGVLSMAYIYKRIVLVTTGSGIGPALSFLLEKDHRTECRILWSTPNPMKYYGSEICDHVKKVDPNALIINSRLPDGKADMVRMAYTMYKKFDAEAVFVISNPPLTKELLYALESRGVPTFGPIWDS